MILKELIEDIKCEVIGDDLINISSIALSDVDCRKNSIFFCLKGNNTDGEKYIGRAVQNGAVAVVSAKPIDDCPITNVVVKDVRRAMSFACKKFYNRPHEKMKLIGVVGTNGKTTVCEAIYNILTEAGIKCGKIGTSGADFCGQHYDTGMTTPDAPQLFYLLSLMAKSGVKIVCMELSAHAIYYKKANFTFDIIVFTNCSRDHLDFFGTVERYRNVKASAFTHRNCRLAVVNSDEPLGLLIALKRKNGTIMYGIEQPSDVFAINICENKHGTNFVINLFDRLYEIDSRLIGRFNVYNLLSVATVCSLCGLKTDYVAERLTKLQPICGRMQLIHSSPDVYVDYAHTPEGLKAALSSLKDVACGRLICVFGCGGNRDSGKRSEMGRISGELADYTVITCDNPRFEDGSAIICEIENGIRTVDGAEYITVIDRKLAIEYALRIAESCDTVLIAGKGNEKYQEVMGVKVPFSDEETACAFFERK